LHFNIISYSYNLITIIRQECRSEYKIAKYFNRSSPIVNRGINSFKKYNENVRAEKRILDSYITILNKVSDFKKETNYQIETTKNL
jgi:hypothetical protein